MWTDESRSNYRTEFKFILFQHNYVATTMVPHQHTTLKHPNLCCKFPQNFNTRTEFGTLPATWIKKNQFTHSPRFSFKQNNGVMIDKCIMSEGNQGLVAIHTHYTHPFLFSAKHMCRFVPNQNLWKIKFLITNPQNDYTIQQVCDFSINFLFVKY